MIAPRQLLAGISAIALSAVLVPQANAIVLINFSEVQGGGNVLTASNNGTGTTTLTITGAAVSVSAIDASSPPVPPLPFNAFLNFHATNTDAAQNVSGTFVQHYSDS